MTDMVNVALVGAGRIARVPGFRALIRRHNVELYAGRPAGDLPN